MGCFNHHGNPQPSFIGVITHILGVQNLHVSWFWGPKVGTLDGSLFPAETHRPLSLVVTIILYLTWFYTIPGGFSRRISEPSTVSVASGILLCPLLCLAAIISSRFI